jgi:hypothetical protein
MAKALKINASDNVAVVLADVKAGEEVGVMTDTDVVQIRAQQHIAFGHKIALRSRETVHLRPDEI